MWRGKPLRPKQFEGAGPADISIINIYALINKYIFITEKSAVPAEEEGLECHNDCSAPVKKRRVLYRSDTLEGLVYWKPFPRVSFVRKAFAFWLFPVWKYSLQLRFPHVLSSSSSVMAPYPKPTIHTVLGMSRHEASTLWSSRLKQCGAALTSCPDSTTVICLYQLGQVDTEGDALLQAHPPSAVRYSGA